MVHDTLSDKALIRIAQIADRFLDKTYLEEYYGSQRDKIKTNFFPIAMLKTPGDNSDNETEMIYFPNCIIDKIMNYHQRE